MTEFTGVDFEISWIESHEDVMSFAGHLWLAHAYKRVQEKRGEAIKAAFDVDLQVHRLPFRLSMAEAYKSSRTRAISSLRDPTKGDLDPGAERALGTYIKEKTGNDFVFVKDWPFSVRPFYHMVYEDNHALTKSFDLLGRGLEITTGAQREPAEVLKNQALGKGTRPCPHPGST